MPRQQLTQRSRCSTCFLFIAAAKFTALAAVGEDFNSGSSSWDYSNVFAPARDAGISFSDLPGFTRSVYERDHALIAPESRVWATFPGWQKSLTAHLISPANGASFVMYLADIKAGGLSGSPPSGVERFAFLLDGSANLTSKTGVVVQELHADDYVYFPAGDEHRLATQQGAGFVIYEALYTAQGNPILQFGSTSQQAVLPVPGEVFALRKLLPQTADYDFNIHIMDFKPGEHLNVKEIHYNQHGLLLLQGKGIYRLADKWYPIQAGDAVWMPPYVIQWFGALGTKTSRYILFKDTSLDPVLYRQCASHK